MPTVDLQGGPVEYFDQGVSDRILILIHGAGSSARIWHTVQALLATEDIRTVAVSLPGAGGTHRPADLDAYQPANYAKVVRGVIDALGITRCAVAGHSLGVSNALYLATDEADGLEIPALIMMAGGAGDERVAPSGDARESIIKAMRERPPGRDAGTGHEAWEPIHLGLPQTIRDQLWDDIVANPPERAIGQRISGRRDMTPFLTETDTPILVVSGDADSVVPLSATLGMYAKLKAGTGHLHVMHGVDHYPNAEDPVAVADAFATFLEGRL